MEKVRRVGALSRGTLVCISPAWSSMQASAFHSSPRKHAARHQQLESSVRGHVRGVFDLI